LIFKRNKKNKYRDTTPFLDNNKLNDNTNNTIKYVKNKYKASNKPYQLENPGMKNEHYVPKDPCEENS